MTTAVVGDATGGSTLLCRRTVVVIRVGDVTIGAGLKLPTAVESTTNDGGDLGGICSPRRVTSVA